MVFYSIDTLSISDEREFIQENLNKLHIYEYFSTMFDYVTIQFMCFMVILNCKNSNHHQLRSYE